MPNHRLEFNQMVSEFKALIEEHGSRSQQVRDYLDEHPVLQQLVDSITDPQVSLEIVK